ncbi:MAG TPA: ABC transporter ATP-binding protein/permease [Candidatus Mailhella merdavium]|nr:ABC transporter ATP-binding protein/permease [Candidatus Mailhella merdavium]
MTLFELFRNIRPYARPYRKLIALTLALTCVASFAAQINAWVLRYTVDSISELVAAHKSLHDGLPLLSVISGILIGTEIINVLIGFGQKYFGEKLRILLSRDLARDIIERILTYRLAFYSVDENQPGKLQTRIDRGVESLARLVQNFFIDILPMFASAAVALTMMFQANFHVGLTAFCIVPVYYQVSRIQAARMAGSRRLIKRLRENKSQGILGILESMPVIKSFLREDIEEQKQLRLQDALTDTQMRIRKTSFFFDGMKNFIEQIGVVAIILLTTYFVLTGSMSIGAIMFHLLLFNNVTAPIRRLHLLYDQMNDALIYAEGFFDVLHAGSQVESSGSYIPTHITGRFSLHNVNFTYPANTSPTLRDINMNIEPGKITALVGLSGAGKSTLINLLDKFYQPDSGEILLDGIPLQEYDTRALRADIGLVLQKNHIFPGTVAENILYGKPSASRDDVIEAARRAFLHDQIMTLPLGYDSQAVNLSGGQQQKIALARMFLKNPPIIFLDEPTASLDAIATEQIKAGLDALKKNRTVIIISHSISQIIDADSIYVMRNGRIVEHGTHNELFANGGEYHDIFAAMARSLNMDKIARTLEHRA